MIVLMHFEMKKYGQSARWRGHRRDTGDGRDKCGGVTEWDTLGLT